MANRSIRKLRTKKHLIHSEHSVLVITKSNAHTSAQVRDKAGKTLFGSSSSKIGSGSKTERARMVGKSLADAAKSHNITQLVVDRNGYLYHGRVKTLVESVREHGITI